MMEEESWDSYDATFKERYPIWAENTFGLDSQHKRKETLDEMRRLFTSDNIDYNFSTFAIESTNELAYDSDNYVNTNTFFNSRNF